MREIDEERYVTACHAMQAGVAMDAQRGSSDTTPKHLRVGINNALVIHGALVKLLVEKGILTDDEYVCAIADAMEAEQRLYEDRLSEELGVKITLV